jgi:type IV secretory pathway VirB2 component (pilin)
MTFSQRIGLRAVAVVFLAQALLPRAYGAPAGAGIPWETPMRLIAQSLTGPVAYAIGLIGIVFTIAMLLWHHDLGVVGQAACKLGLAVAVLIFAAPMLASAFGAAGAVI